MYPFIRLAAQSLRAHRLPDLPLDGTHVSHHLCLPWDLDPFLELNNGRTLTLYDLGRIPLAHRVGLIGALRDNGWGLTMAGACVRYRRRVRLFDRLEMRSRALCWDARFIYLEQSIWRRDGECAGHILYRAAVTDENGIVGTERVLQALGQPGETRDIPEWVARWIAAEDARPWPPMQD
ncbi:acyl-CoA thioesterase [Lutimaribacter sp. EGI FJ00015]|uniref:Acyl-CoA thioesterase n=1 Tax=Lutimaribacter degradans TaxID=2945989 RepID=A0ACC5ZW99_9RHOB|nr:acyl-CoA thioesterase [Lutimaribacter sp. EGI FJ00013]MCM2562577.1 acyl-CoA thioesterase [Lutimaribacter sp. EGI FJ00013]MCO0613734.1 acyl-CoA thioesterase [Lutimaribacter sp. EGI FJ00015]MCO0636783.1 acyl-CoA thioesterase [Lutimaribacter sp. EGI FJ00014]